MKLKVSAEKRFNEQQHCSTTTHSSCVARSVVNNCRQVHFHPCNRSRICVKWWLNIPCFRQFFEKYTTHPVPDEATLRKHYISVCYKVLNKMSVADQKVWVSIDETTDVDGRYVAYVIVGILRIDCPREIFLPVCEALKIVNNCNCHFVWHFCEATFIRWCEKGHHFVTSDASYMAKAAKELQILYPSIVYVTCLAHASHRVAEEVWLNYTDMNKLISCGKKISADIQRTSTFTAPSPQSVLGLMLPSITAPTTPK